MDELSERVNELSTDDAKGAMGASACGDGAEEAAANKPAKLSKAQRRRVSRAPSQYTVKTLI